MGGGLWLSTVSLSFRQQAKATFARLNRVEISCPAGWEKPCVLTEVAALWGHMAESLAGDCGVRPGLLPPCALQCPPRLQAAAVGVAAQAAGLRISGKASWRARVAPVRNKGFQDVELIVKHRLPLVFLFLFFEQLKVQKAGQSTAWMILHLMLK